ncbi:helix-turn-helix domain-containing protein [Streptomyces hirsutus]|uniref:helix-turn-helix domain-containing protein n=1 Tax=Streptomyces hirsutus TaxID=35620 RepID=UPI00331F01F5
MVAANVTIEGLADHLGIDPKSVDRWLNSDRTPHARNAEAAAKLLRVDAYHLWPKLGERHRSTPTAQDEVVVPATRCAPPSPTACGAPPWPVPPRSSTWRWPTCCSWPTRSGTCPRCWPTSPPPGSGSASSPPRLPPGRSPDWATCSPRCWQFPACGCPPIRACGPTCCARTMTCWSPCRSTGSPRPLLRCCTCAAWGRLRWSAATWPPSITSTPTRPASSHLRAVAA